MNEQKKRCPNCDKEFENHLEDHLHNRYEDCFKHMRSEFEKMTTDIKEAMDNLNKEFTAKLNEAITNYGKSKKKRR